MRITCDSCGAAIAGADIDLPRGVGRCAICSAETPLPDPGSALDTARPASVTPEGARPLGFRSDVLPWRERPIEGGTAFELRPALPQRLVTAAVGAFFLLFLFAQRGDAIFAIFRAVVGIVAAWPIYRVLQSGLNRTRLTFDASGLRIARGPLPERRAVTIPLGNILSFAAGPASIMPTIQAERTAWGVRLLTTDRNLVELPLSTANREDADWMAARLNLALDEARGGGEPASTRSVTRAAPMKEGAATR